MERQKLLQDQYQYMQNAIGAKHGMWGPGMIGGPGMMGWGSMHGQYSKLTPEQMKQRQYMMDHMMQRQQWMTPPTASTGK